MRCFFAGLYKLSLLSRLRGTNLKHPKMKSEVKPEHKKTIFTYSWRKENVCHNWYSRHLR